MHPKLTAGSKDINHCNVPGSKGCLVQSIIVYTTIYPLHSPQQQVCKPMAWQNQKPQNPSKMSW